MEEVKLSLYEFEELKGTEERETAKQQVSFHDIWNECFMEDSLESRLQAIKLYRKFDIGTSKDKPIVIKGLRLYKFIQNRILPHLKAPKVYNADGRSYYTTVFDNIPTFLTKTLRKSNISFEYSPIHLTDYKDDYTYLEPIFEFLKNPDPNTTNLDLLNIDMDEIYNNIYEAEEKHFYEDTTFADYCDICNIKFLSTGVKFQHIDQVLK